MITKKINIERGNLHSCLNFGCKGDSIVLKTDFPVIGIKSVLGINIDGIYSSLKFEFRGSVDSVNWSDWKELTLQNLNSLDFNKLHPFQVEYRVTCTDSGQNYLYSINLEFEYESFPTPTSFDSTPFKQFMTFSNRKSLLWAVNVLEKMYKSGIVPEFIDRGENRSWEDIDYLDFWWPTIYYNALKVSYDSVFKETLFRPELLQDFLKQRDLYPGTEKDLGQLYYLATNYYNEIRRRGTPLIKEESLPLPSLYEGVEVRGELLRLLNCTSDEIEDFILTGDDIGWYVGKSSPLYQSGTSVENIIKGFEYTKDYENPSKYPFLNPQFIEKISTEISPERTGSCMKLLPDRFISCGIVPYSDWEIQKNFSIKVNPKFSYEITFLIKGGSGQKINFGVTCFNQFGHNLGDSLSVRNLEIETSYFYKGKVEPSLGGFVLVRGILWSYFSPQLEGSVPKGFSKGQNLKFKRLDVTYICPVLNVTGDGGEAVHLYDFKVRPCKIDTSSYVSQEDLLYLRGESKNEELSTEKVQKIINNKLIPYNMELVLQSREDG